MTRIDSHQHVHRLGKVLWLTGLSGSGKSTIANEVCRALQSTGARATVLDGDILRNGLCSDLGFSATDRSENIRRVTEAAKILYSEGFIVLVALISPYRKDRESARQQFSSGAFYEIHCDCDIRCCAERDVKGLYKLARSGNLRDFTGISAPYEPPEKPELWLDTSRESLANCAQEALALLNRPVKQTNTGNHTILARAEE